MLVTPPAAQPTLASLLLAWQAEATALLAKAGYPALVAQVSACLLPSGPNFTVSAPDPTTVFYDNLSYGAGATPEAALQQFGQRLATALVKEAA